jgi:hypothetical protein
MGIEAYAKKITADQLAVLQRNPLGVKDLLLINYARTYAADLCLEKDWHLIHYLLTDDTDWGNASTLHKAVLGGTPLPEAEDLFSYGPPRYLTPDEVKEVAFALGRVLKRDTAARYYAACGRDLNIYGMPSGGWQPEEWEDLWEVVRDLKGFFKSASRDGCAVVHYMG